MEGTPLRPDEGLALAGLVRLLIRLDGQLTESERAILSWIAEEMPRTAAEIAVGGYRDVARSVPTSEESPFWELLERAATELPDDEAVRMAALRVTRKEAQTTIHGMLYQLAASDAIAKPEWALLEWLEKAWDLRE